VALYTEYLPRDCFNNDLDLLFQIFDYDLGIIMAGAVGLIFILITVSVLITICVCRRKGKCGGQTYQTYHAANEKFKLAFIILNFLSLAMTL
jgi:hypothetical protein